MSNSHFPTGRKGLWVAVNASAELAPLLPTTGHCSCPEDGCRLVLPLHSPPPLGSAWAADHLDLRAMSGWFRRQPATAPAAPAAAREASEGAPAAGGSPLELIRYDQNTGKFELGAQALAVLKQTRGPVGVVAVCGRARQVSRPELCSRRLRAPDCNSSLAAPAAGLGRPQDFGLFISFGHAWLSDICCILPRAGQVLHPQPAAGAQWRLPGCTHAPPLHQRCAAALPLLPPPLCCLPCNIPFPSGTCMRFQCPL